MTSSSKDSSYSVDALAAWRETATPFHRIQMASALHEMAREIIADEIRDAHPAWSDLAVAQEVARRLLADENLPMLYPEDLFASQGHREAYLRLLDTPPLADNADR
jgi:hypothetical protein